MDVFKFIVILSIAAQLSLAAKPDVAKKQFLVCLGKEEHQHSKIKEQGPLFYLNQSLISAFIQLRKSLRMNSLYEARVCKSKHPGLEIIRLMLTRDRIFISDFDTKKDPFEHSIDMKTLKELNSKVYGIFVDFLSRIQAQMLQSECLEKIIPELKNFLLKTRYVESDVGLEEIISEIKPVRKTLSKIEKLLTLDLAAIKKCGPQLL